MNKHCQAISYFHVFSCFSRRMTDKGVANEQLLSLRSNDEESEEAPINIIKWCQITQEKALLKEAKSEKFGITKKERKFLRDQLGYTKKRRAVAMRMEEEMRRDMRAQWMASLAGPGWARRGGCHRMLI